MKKSLLIVTLVACLGSSALISACSSKQSRTDSMATEPAPVQQQQQELAKDANLGASSSGRGR